MDLTPFDFDLPEAQIALRPTEPRDHARLLVVHGDGRLQDRIFYELPDLLQQGDTLVFNDTRVLPAALKAVRPARDETGHDIHVDLNLVSPLAATEWRALARPGKRLKVGDVLQIADGFAASVLRKGEGGEIDLAFQCAGGELRSALEAYGNMPLPPYIARKRAADSQDKTDYQTRFAGNDAASVAAPTAGLHFTTSLLASLAKRELRQETVRLHVGLGTFSPLTEAQWATRKLHEEWRSLEAETATRLNMTRAKNRRIIPVGTTAMRTLESAVDSQGHLYPVTGPTDIFIQPGDKIQITDGLVTNFHLPRSSLFMLVCALMGTEIMQLAYAHAIRENYRFYSYGDACLLLP